MDAVNELRHALVAVAILADVAHMTAYMKQIAPFLGVKADARRRVVRQWCAAHAIGAAEDVVVLARQLCDEPEREFQYAAADMTAYWLHLLDSSFVAQQAEALLLHTPWWDTVDL
jgi:3-methyladenine DNA glycosylase AlkD